MTLKLTHSFNGNTLPYSLIFHVPKILTSENFHENNLFRGIKYENNPFDSIKEDILKALREGVITKYALFDTLHSFELHLESQLDQTLFLYHYEGDCDEENIMTISINGTDTKFLESTLRTIMRDLQKEDLPQFTKDKKEQTLSLNFHRRAAYLYTAFQIIKLQGEDDNSATAKTPQINIP